jgi:hypothetical protein
VPDFGNGVYSQPQSWSFDCGHRSDVEARRRHDRLVAVQGATACQVDSNGTLYASCDISRKLVVIDPKTLKVSAAIDTDGTGHWARCFPTATKPMLPTRTTDASWSLSLFLLCKRSQCRTARQASPCRPTAARAALDLSDFAVIDTQRDAITACRD